MEYSEKIKLFNYRGRKIRLFNQEHPGWTHPYPYTRDPELAKATLHTSGCGIFAIAHLIEFVCDSRIDPEALADFSVLRGGRGDDGTDRPALLDAMEAAGRLAPYRLHYASDGLRNDPESLWETLLKGGAALCNLRPGHIVSVVDWRIQEGEKQLLIMDSSADSTNPDVLKHIRECVAGSEIINAYTSAAGIHGGMRTHFAMYWVPAELPCDFSLLNRVEI